MSTLINGQHEVVPVLDASSAPSAASVSPASSPTKNTFYPVTEPPIGSLLPESEWPQNRRNPKLFQPLKLRDLTLKNRISVAPMCQYSSVDGHVTDWHLVHLGSFATRGAGSICVEATAVTPEGRITPQDNGIWADSHVPGLKRIVDFVHAHGTPIGIQLAHAGRKASTRSPFLQYDVLGRNRFPDTDVASVEEGGWPDGTLAPSAIPFNDKYTVPTPLSENGIETLIEAFGQATRRAKEAGFDFVEIHGAHGYLLHEFKSPLTNKRTDKYGGSLENRLRFPLQVARRVRAEWGEEKPIFYRLSGTDWAEGPEKNESGEWLQWGIEQSTELVRELQAAAGIDLVDVSSGGNWFQQKIPIWPLYQVPLAEYVKKHVPNAIVGAVGLITTTEQAEGVLQDGKADLIRLARELLRNIDFPLKAASDLGVAVRPTVQYERAFNRMLSTKPKF